MKKVTYEILMTHQANRKKWNNNFIVPVPPGYEANIIDFIKEYRKDYSYQHDLIDLLLQNDFLSSEQCRFFGIWCALKCRHVDNTWHELHRRDLIEYYNHNNTPEGERLISTRESDLTPKTETHYSMTNLTYPNPVWWAGCASRRDAESHYGESKHKKYEIQLDYLLSVLELEAGK